MAFDYSIFENLSTDLITEFGRTFTLRKSSSTPVSASRPWGDVESDAVASDDVEITDVNGVFLDQVREDASTGGFTTARTARTRSDQGARLLIEPRDDLQTAGFDQSDTNWVVIDGATRYEVLSVDVVKPGPTEVLYKVEVRQ